MKIENWSTEEGKKRRTRALMRKKTDLWSTEEGKKRRTGELRRKKTEIRAFFE